MATAGEIKPGDRVRVVLDVLEVLADDTPINDKYYEGVYAAAGSLRLGYANQPGDDSITTSPDLVTPVPPMVTLSPERWTEIADAVESGDSWTASGIHLNYGDSDAYIEMWNAGHDAAVRGAPCVVPDELLANLPDRTRERAKEQWIEGWRFATVTDLPWHDALPAVAALLHEPGLAAAVSRFVGGVYRARVAGSLDTVACEHFDIRNSDMEATKRLAAALEVGDGK